MKELSLNILDIAQNSFSAGASLTEVILNEDKETLEITIKDNGCGMDKETVKQVSNPFYTTRTTRSVGLGIPLLTLAAEQTGGRVTVESNQSTENHGTVIKSLFYKNHIDFTPLGDISSTVCLLAQGCGNGDVLFVHSINGGEKARLDTRMLREVLAGLPLSNPEVQLWIRDYVKQQYE